MDMQLRRNPRPPSRYGDEIEQSHSGANSSIMVVRGGQRGTTPAFKIPCQPYNPSLIHTNPAAFPSRDIAANWGPLAATSGTAQGLRNDDSEPSTPKQWPQDEVLRQNPFTEQQLRRLTPKTRSFRAILPTSGVRSDSATKLPRKQKSKTDTVRRRRPPPNPAIVNFIPHFPDLEAKEPRLEEVWAVFGEQSSSFLNQAVSAPPHDLQDLMDRLHASNGPNSVKRQPSLVVYEEDNLNGRPPGKGIAGPLRRRYRVRDRGSLLMKPVDFTKMHPQRKAAWRNRYGTNHSVDPENGPLYDAEFADDDFFLEAASSGDERPRYRIQNFRQMSLDFDQLVAQLAIDIYCQIYFEAAPTGADAKSMCRNLLDFTSECDECMRWVIANRLLYKVDEVSVPYQVPEVELDREVRPGASPLVSSFALQKDKDRLVSKDVDWNYVAAADLETAKAFLREKELPQSLLRDWISERETEPAQQVDELVLPPPLQQPPNGIETTNRALEDEISADRAGASEPNKTPSNRGRKRPQSDSEYYEEDDHGSSASTSRHPTPCPTQRREPENQLQQQQEPQQPPAATHPQHVPPRPSFARPGASIARPKVALGSRGGRTAAPSPPPPPLPLSSSSFASTASRGMGRGVGRGQPARAAGMSRGGGRSGVVAAASGSKQASSEGMRRGRGRPPKKEGTVNGS